MLKRFVSIYRYYFWSPERYAKYIGVSIGNRCRIMTKEFGSEPYLIKIGNQVQITSGVRFSTHGGGWTLRNKYPDFDTFGKIVIGDNVYIGNCALILPGVTIGSNVIIGAGTVVSKSILDNSIVVGNPGRVIGNFEDYERKISPFNLNTKRLKADEKRSYLLSLSDDKFIIK